MLTSHCEVQQPVLGVKEFPTTGSCEPIRTGRILSLVMPIKVEAFLQTIVNVFFFTFFIFPIIGLHYFVLKPTTALVKGVARKSKGGNCRLRRFLKFGFWLNFLVPPKPRLLKLRIATPFGVARFNFGVAKQIDSVHQN